MNEVLAILQLISLIIVAYFEYKNQSISIFLWATLIVMAGGPHLLSIFSGKYIYSDSVMIQASAFIILFNLIYFITRFLMFNYLNRSNFETLNIEFINNKNNKNIKQDKRIINILFVSVLSALIIVCYTSITRYGSIFSTSWGDFFQDSKSAYEISVDSGTAMLVAKYLVFASGGVIISMIYYKNYKLATITAICIILYSTITRNRITMLPFVVAIISLYISKNRNIGIKQILVFTILGCISVYIVYAMRLFRHYGTIENFIREFDLEYFNNRMVEMMISGNGELGLIDAFYYFIQNNNNFPNFGKMHTYIRLLLIAVPTRFSFGLKPPDFAISMGSAYINDFNNTIVSMHGTIYADLYGNLGWMGICLGIIWAIMVFVIDKFINSKNKVIKSAMITLFGCVYVIVGRGSVYNAFYIAFISSIFLKVVYTLFGKYKFIFK